MTATTSAQWITTVPGTHQLSGYVEIWSPSVLLGRLPIITGNVTDAWVTGQRRTLTMTVPPTTAIKAWLTPGVELRPYFGINYGYGPPELVAMGRFPVVNRDIDLLNTDISLTCQDRWQWVVLSPFLSPRVANVGIKIRDQIALLLVETGQWVASDITNTVTSNAVMVAQTWDSDRHQAIVGLCTAVGAEAFIGRDGKPVIRDRQAVATAARNFYTGSGGALLNIVETQSTADVYNVVRVVSTLTDPAFVIPPIIVRITDPTNPAFPVPGKVTTRTYNYTSSQVQTTAQATAAAQKILTKISGKARSLALTVIPDHALDASDTIKVNWPTGGLVDTVQIQQVVHPFRAADTQTISTVSSRTDESFLP